MELFGCDDFTLKALFSCFRVFVYTLQNGTFWKRWFHSIKNATCERINFENRQKKKLWHFQKKIGYVWTGPDSVINLSQTRDNLFQCTHWGASNWMCTDKREWAKLLGLQGWTVPAMPPYLWLLIDWYNQPTINRLFIGLRYISLHVFRINSYIILVPSSLG